VPKEGRVKYQQVEVTQLTYICHSGVMGKDKGRAHIVSRQNSVHRRRQI
jgi:hypothetical protein